MKRVLVFIMALAVYSLNVLAAPNLIFNPPTLVNQSITLNNWTEINVSIQEPNLDTFIFNWNGTNYNFYDSSLVLDLNFNNNSAIGENSTYAVDSSRYGNNGTMIDENTSNADGNIPPYYVNGKFGMGLNFDGVDDHVDCGNASSLNLNPPLTYEAWIYPKSFDTAGVLYFMTKGVADNNCGIGFGVGGTSNGANKGSLFLYNGSTAVFSTAPLSINKWYHVVATNDGTTTRLYINGALNNSGSQTLVNCPQYAFWIGSRASYPILRFNGIIDEARVYSRALSADEIKMHYLTEMAKYNASEYRFYINNTNLNDGTYTYYAWANNTTNSIGQSETRTLYVGCGCENCYVCNYKLSSSVCSEVKLVNDILNYPSGTCINNPSQSNKIFNCQGFKVDGDYSKNDYGIYFYQKSNITIKNCYVSRFHEGIFLQTCSNSYVYNNTVFNNTDVGIVLYTYSHDNVIENNTVNYTSWTGIFLKDSWLNRVRNNKVDKSSSQALYLYNSSNNTVDNNTLLNSNNNGMLIYTDAASGYNNYNNITNNVVQNQVNGMRIYYSQFNNISFNNISNSTAKDISVELNALNNMFFNNILNYNFPVKFDILDYNQNFTIFRVNTALNTTNNKSVYLNKSLNITYLNGYLNFSIYYDNNYANNYYENGYRIYYNASNWTYISSSADTTNKKINGYTTSIGEHGILLYDEVVPYVWENHESFYPPSFLRSIIYPGKDFVYQFNATITDNTSYGIGNVSQVFLEFNGQNYTAIRNGNVFSVNITNLDVGSYPYKWFAIDNFNNTNVSNSYLLYIYTYAGGSVSENPPIVNVTIKNETIKQVAKPFSLFDIINNAYSILQSFSDFQKAVIIGMIVGSGYLIYIQYKESEEKKRKAKKVKYKLRQGEKK